MAALNAPLKFIPYFKSVIWGGNKIAEYKAITINRNDIGESWELSVVPGHVSTVSEGRFSGMLLTELVAQFGAELLGSKVVEQFGKSFPLLIKFIDAQSDLSVQVHPNDELAKERHNSKGKTEMWYVIDSKDDAVIRCGLCAPLNKQEYKERIANNTIMDVVAKHKSLPGQIYFIPAGTLHAICAGNLIAEIQQNSDITYRVYDYNRKDSNGNTRQLHTEEAIDAINYTYPLDIKPTGDVIDKTTPKAVSCKYFTTDLIKSNNEDTFDVSGKGESFVIIIAVNGSGSLITDNKITEIKQGETILIPATLKDVKLKLSGTVLKVYIAS
jgi:mannose-6-phosphate isomerase